MRGIVTIALAWVALMVILAFVVEVLEDLREP